MAAKKVSSDNFVAALNGELVKYSREVRTQLRAAGQECIDGMVDETKATAPAQTGSYRDHIASKPRKNTANAISFLWYVQAPDYRLTHLLNNGHANRGGGRTPGDGHVTKAAENAAAKFEQLCKEVLKNAGR